MMHLMNRQRCQVLTMLAFFIMGKAGDQALYRYGPSYGFMRIEDTCLVGKGF